MRSVSLSATLFLLFAPSSTAGADLAPSALTVAITVRPASIEGQGHILVDFEFKNPTSSDERLEKWLALEPPEVTIALLRISRADGSPVRYIGEHINRRHIGAASYLRIPARGSRVVKAVDVTVFTTGRRPQKTSPSGTKRSRWPTDGCSCSDPATSRCTTFRTRTDSTGAVTDLYDPRIDASASPA